MTNPLMSHLCESSAVDTRDVTYAQTSNPAPRDRRGRLWLIHCSPAGGRGLANICILHQGTMHLWVFGDICIYIRLICHKMLSLKSGVLRLIGLQRAISCTQRSRPCHSSKQQLRNFDKSRDTHAFIVFRFSAAFYGLCVRKLRLKWTIVSYRGLLRSWSTKECLYTSTETDYK